MFDIEAIIAFVQQLFQKEWDRPLKDIEKEILRSCLKADTPEELDDEIPEIDDDINSATASLRSMHALLLWHNLTLVTRERVTKSNCREVLTRLLNQSEDSVDRHPPFASGNVAPSGPPEDPLLSLQQQLYQTPFERAGWQGEDIFGSDYPNMRPEELAAYPFGFVDCSVFGPKSMALAETALVQVFVHLPNHQQQVLHAARMADGDTSLRTSKTLGLEVWRGYVLTFHLTVPGLDIDSPIQSLTWLGKPASVDFLITAPENLTSKTVFGTVLVSHNSVPLGTLKFKVTIGPKGQDSSPIPISNAARLFRKAFVSYSSKDRQEVLKRVQALVSTGMEVFQDILNLEPGERWEQRLYQEIGNADLFLLFWSAAARDSQWVIKEALYALECQGLHPDKLPEIIPILLEGPPAVTPPPELCHLHFQDTFVYLIAAS